MMINMETKFNFNSQVCTDKNQSERLLALGLKKETADIRGVEGIEHTPTYAWSLHRLIEMMPIAINDILWFNATHDTVLYDSLDYTKTFDVNDNLYGNIIDCIEWLIKGGYFNKEYLD